MNTHKDDLKFAMDISQFSPNPLPEKAKYHSKTLQKYIKENLEYLTNHSSGFIAGATSSKESEKDKPVAETLPNEDPAKISRVLFGILIIIAGTAFGAFFGYYASSVAYFAIPFALILGLKFVFNSEFEDYEDSWLNESPNDSPYDPGSSNFMGYAELDSRNS